MALVVSMLCVLMFLPGINTSARYYQKWTVSDKIQNIDSQYKFDWYCVSGEYIRRLLFATLGQVILVLNLGLSAICTTAWKSSAQRWLPLNLQRICLARGGYIWRRLTIASCIVAMWAFPAFYLVNQQTLIGKRGGTTNKDSDFSFGQALALSTWAPVLIELGYIYWEGPKKALTGKIMAPFYVASSENLGNQGAKSSGLQSQASIPLLQTDERSGSRQTDAVQS
jgi:hypothetical protein